MKLTQRRIGDSMKTVDEMMDELKEAIVLQEVADKYSWDSSEDVDEGMMDENQRIENLTNALIEDGLHIGSVTGFREIIYKTIQKDKENKFATREAIIGVGRGIIGKENSTVERYIAVINETKKLIRAEQIDKMKWEIESVWDLEVETLDEALKYLNKFAKQLVLESNGYIKEDELLSLITDEEIKKIKNFSWIKA